MNETQADEGGHILQQRIILRGNLKYSYALAY